MGALGGKRWSRVGGLADGWSRRLAPHRRPDAIEVLRSHWAGATRACRRVLPVRFVPDYFRRISQVVLQLALSRGIRFRIPVEAGPRHLRSNLSTVTLGRYRAALFEIRPAELLCLRCGEHVGGLDRGIPRQPVCPHRRRAHVELLPLPRWHGGILPPRIGDRVHLRTELLVPLPL